MLDATRTPSASAIAGPASSSDACESCGTPQARMWSTPQGRARLCPPCATLHGIGCP